MMPMSNLKSELGLRHDLGRKKWLSFIVLQQQLLLHFRSQISAGKQSMYVRYKYILHTYTDNFREIELFYMRSIMAHDIVYIFFFFTIIDAHSTFFVQISVSLINKNISSSLNTPRNCPS